MTSRMRSLCGAALAALMVTTASAQTPPQDRSAKHPGLTSVKVDLKGVDRIVGDHQVLVFGEDSHEMAAEHDAVRQIFQHLASAKGFRLLVFEAQWGLEDKLHDFMTSDRTTLNDEERFFLDGAFASKSTAELLVWIRDFNRAHPKEQIRIAGFQPEQPVTDFQAVWTFLAKASPDSLERLQAVAAPCRAGDPKLKVDMDFMMEGFKRQKQKLPVYTAEERQACLTALTGIKADLQGRRAALAAHSSDVEVEEAILHLDSFAYYAGGIRRVADEITTHPDAPLEQQAVWQHDAYQTGDNARMEVFRVLLKTRYAGKKMMFWMHDWHAAKHGSELGLISPTSPGIPKNTTTIGERLAAYFGPRLAAIDSIVPCGKTCAEPADSVEPAFADFFKDQAAVVDLHRPTPAEKAALPIDRKGSFFANFHGFGGGGLVLDRQYDGVLYIPSSTTTQPG